LEGTKFKPTTEIKVCLYTYIIFKVQNLTTKFTTDNCNIKMHRNYNIEGGYCNSRY